MARRDAIAIAGGGMAGLTLALALARRDIPSVVLEQAPRLEELGAGLQISPNAWRVLADLGLEDRLLAASDLPAAVRIRSGRNGREIARMPLGRRAEARWGAPYRIVHRADLQAMLAEAVRDSGRAEISLGTRIAGFERADAGVRVVPEGGGERRFAGLVGADGLWSTIRRDQFNEGPPRYSGKVAWRAAIPVAEAPAGLDVDGTDLWLGRDAHLVHYTVRGGAEINVVAVVAGDWREAGWSATGEPAEIAARFAEWPDPARALVAGATTWGCWALADRPPLRRWGDGAVTLAGDAAHPMLPFLAQGAAMGIEDGAVIAASVAASDSLAAAFRRYENLRVARTAQAQRAARANGDVYHLGGVAARARDAALGVMGPRRLMARMDWLYGWRP